MIRPHRRTYMLPLLFAGVLLVAAPLRAQRIPSPYIDLTRKNALTLQAGYLFTDPTVNLTDSTSAAFGPRSAPTLGLRYGRMLSSAVALEVGAMFSPTEREIYKAGVGADTTQVTAVPTGTRASMPLLMVDVGARLNLTGARSYRGIAPYVAASGGIATSLRGLTAEEKQFPSTERFEFGPAFALGLRAGSDWYLSQRLSLNVEAGDVLWKVKVPPGLRSGGRTAVQSEWTNNLGLRAGVAVHF